MQGRLSVLVNIDRDSVDSNITSTLRPLTLNPQPKFFAIDDFPLNDPVVTGNGLAAGTYFVELATGNASGAANVILNVE